MKTSLFTLLLLAFSITAFSQQDTTHYFGEEIYVVVEEQPQFPGGYEKMMEFLGENINYPKNARNKGIEGRVIVQFVVNKEGKIEDVKLIKDIGEGCGEEAMRVVKMMPDWTPGYQRGVAVKVRFNLPVKFTLEAEEAPKRNIDAPYPRP